MRPLLHCPWCSSVSTRTREQPLWVSRAALRGPVLGGSVHTFPLHRAVFWVRWSCENQPPVHVSLVEWAH